VLHLLTTAVGTTRLCPDVRDHGESWRVSGLLDSACTDVTIVRLGAAIDIRSANDNS
jgi:hypothetical protein